MTPPDLICIYVQRWILTLPRAFAFVCMSPNSWRHCLLESYQRLTSLKNDDPRFIAARTYGLSLSLSLGPALISLIARGPLTKKKYARTLALLKKELSSSGFAFAMTVAVGGGAALEALWQHLLQIETGDEPTTRHSDSKIRKPLPNIPISWPKLSAHQRSIVCNAITALVAISLMRRGKRSAHIPSPSIPSTVHIQSSGQKTSRTLDLTLLLLVRALDSIFQGFFQRIAHSPSEYLSPEGEVTHAAEIRRSVATMTDKLDAMLFWIASSR